MRWVCSIVISVLVSGASGRINYKEAREIILEGVSSLHGGSQPGKMTVLGPTAAVIAYYPNPADGPLIAAAVLGKGRIIAVPDHQMLDCAEQADGGLFIQNGLRWLTDSDSFDKVILCRQEGLVSHLQRLGFTQARYSKNPASELAGADVIIGWLGSNLRSEDLNQILTFVENGGSLFLADYGIGYTWWWKKPLYEAPSNILLRETGIAYVNGNIDDPDLIEVYPATGTSPSLEGLIDVISREHLDNKQVAIEASALIAGLATALSPDSEILARLDYAIEGRLENINPTPKTPVSDPLEKALLLREGVILSKTPPEKVVAHRNAEAVYGSIQEMAKRLSGKVLLNTDRARWLPTGLYAPPGELITLTFPSSLVGKGYRVCINAHTDNISIRSSWERPPMVHRSFPIDTEEIKVASAFGGSIFIDMGNIAPNLGLIPVRAKGVIKQPYFVLGKHTNRDWERNLKTAPAPYAVLEGKNMIICMPSRDLTQLTRPEALLEWWDSVVTLQDTLSGQTKYRTHPELMNVDVQISHGGAHAGYPYQAYDKYWNNPADFINLTENGSWGDFHELGHNHQRNHWWTFTGDIEVTVNIFSSYVLASLNPDATSGWAWVLSKEESLRRARDCWAAGRSYAQEPDVGTRLTFYMLLAHEFGWEPFGEVFASYEADAKNHPDALPKNNDPDKIDQWCIRFSKAVQRNISPYMRDQWGISIGDEALLEVAGLPDWKIDE